MKPHMDHVCNAKACRTPEGASPIYDLPVDARTCPYGHRSIRKVFNQVNVVGAKTLQPDFDPKLTSSSTAVIKDTLMRPGFDMAEKGTSAHGDSRLPGNALTSYTPTSLPDDLRRTTPIANILPAMRSRIGGDKGRPMTYAERLAAHRRDPLSVSSTIGRIEKPTGRIPHTIIEGRG